MNPEKICLLASQPAIQRIQSRSPDFCASYIEAFRPYTPGHSIDAATMDDVNVALLSKDITANSTKFVTEPALGVFSDLLLSARNLRWVQIHSAGTDRPLHISLKERGILITTAAGANASVVAQNALAAVLCLSRKFRMLQEAQRNRQWRPLLGEHMPRDLEGQTVVIVGWGSIGRKLGTYLRQFDMHITAVRHQPLGGPGGADAQAGVRMISYDDFKRDEPAYDWVILTCPLTDVTFQLVNRSLISKMPASSYIVNVSRGEVVDEAALTEALKENRLAGAYMDVFAHEPLQADSPLWGLPNTIVSPHSAGHSSGNYDKVIDIFMKNVRLWVEGKPLINRAI
jgi:phosphoglycerate dehydrogenase-like enzyme